jgi:Amt family ammonium transporter
VAVGLYSFTIAWILGKVIDKTMGFRVSAEDEAAGVDITQHAETAYDFGAIHLGHSDGLHREPVGQEAPEAVTKAR